MEYYAFISKYPKFQNLAMAFRVFRSMIPKLTQWFMSEECRALDNSDFYSEHYWMDVDDVEMDEDAWIWFQIPPQWKTAASTIHKVACEGSWDQIERGSVGHEPFVNFRSF